MDPCCAPSQIGGHTSLRLTSILHAAKTRSPHQLKVDQHTVRAHLCCLFRVFVHAPGALPERKHFRTRVLQSSRFHISRVSNGLLRSLPVAFAAPYLSD